MKICFLAHNPMGGFKSFLVNYTKLLVEAGNEVTLAFIGNAILELDGATICRLAPWACDKKKRNQDRFFLEYIKKILKKSLVILRPRSKKIARRYSLFSYQFNCAKKVLRSSTIIDLMEYDCVVSGEEVLCNYFLAHNVLAKRKIGFIHPDYLSAGFDASIDLRFLPQLDLICGVSESSARSLERALPTLKGKIRGIPNPLSTKDIDGRGASFRLNDFDKEKTNLITVCRLDNSSKALDRLVRVAKKMKVECGGFVWRIIGDGPYREEFKKMISKEGLEGEVLLLGGMDNPFPYVRASDLFVLQSYYEGYPISACEALILGTPVFLTDFPSAIEIVMSSFEGFVVKNDEKTIACELEKALNNRSQLRDMKRLLDNEPKTRFSCLDRFLEAIKKEG